MIFSQRATHPVTALNPNYANFDGSLVARFGTKHEFQLRRVSHGGKLVGGLVVVGQGCSRTGIERQVAGVF